ncbi:MAG: sulfatase-like hydrolase/transferase, partial [Cyclobacteriaceae bacterium]|nr:sulfatase-like hydrolase/transferase [Cyclobacteriaceae bacterium]
LTTPGQSPEEFFRLKNKWTVLVAVVLFAISCKPKQIQETKRPNIIFIMADDMGYECLSSYGNIDYQTPRLDQLASSGIRFENFHSQPICTPSRVQVMTGQYNIRNYVQFGLLDREQYTFGRAFKNAGYKTCIAGKWQLGKETDSPQHFGFEQSCLWQQTQGRTGGGKSDTRYPNPIIDINGKTHSYKDGNYGPDVASDFICDFIDQNADSTFFVYYPMMLVHCPFVPTPKSKNWNPEDMGSEEYKGYGDSVEMKMNFKDMVAYTDYLVGKIIDKLDEKGLRENTLIVFTGDNGTDLPIVTNMGNGGKVIGAKGSTIDSGTHTPFMASWPGKIEPGLVTKELADLTDVFPTLCRAAKIDLPQNVKLDGNIFLPFLRSKEETSREWIYSWYHPRMEPGNRKEWARNEKYKLYRTGELYNVLEDHFETSPLDPLTEEQI